MRRRMRRLRRHEERKALFSISQVVCFPALLRASSLVGLYRATDQIVDVFFIVIRDLFNSNLCHQKHRLNFS
jgi:hypothetical protein